MEIKSTKEIPSCFGCTFCHKIVYPKQGEPQAIWSECSIHKQKVETHNYCGKHIKGSGTPISVSTTDNYFV